MVTKFQRGHYDSNNNIFSVSPISVSAMTNATSKQH